MRAPNFWIGHFFYIPAVIDTFLHEVKSRSERFQLSEMTIGWLPKLGNEKIFIFYISNVGLVPTDIAYDIAVHCDQIPPNPSAQFAFPKKIFKLEVRAV